MSTLQELRELNVRKQRESHPAPAPVQDTDAVAGATQTSGSVDDSTIASSQHSNHDSNIAAGKARKRHSDRHRQQDTNKASDIASIVASLKGEPGTLLVQLNIRIPPGMNDWLEEEAHRRRKQGVTKQSLVTEALELLIARTMTEELVGEDK